jgi:hypothetical protein
MAVMLAPALVCRRFYRIAGRPAIGRATASVSKIAALVVRHPMGTKSRLAPEVLFHTSGQREDAVRLGPRHIRNGPVRFMRAKNARPSLSTSCGIVNWPRRFPPAY